MQATKDTPGTVLEAIDRPIRDLVIEINRIGLKTTWSCCGFNYQHEEEAKSHNTVPFVTFENPKGSEQIAAFFQLAYVAQIHRWILHNIYADQWRVFFPSRNHISEGWVPSEGQQVAIHAYEEYLIAIVQLTQAIKTRIPTLHKEVLIEDGNERQKRMYPLIATEWQIEPKQAAQLNFND